MNDKYLIQLQKLHAYVDINAHSVVKILGLELPALRVKDPWVRNLSFNRGRFELSKLYTMMIVNDIVNGIIYADDIVYFKLKNFESSILKF